MGLEEAEAAVVIAIAIVLDLILVRIPDGRDVYPNVLVRVLYADALLSEEMEKVWEMGGVCSRRGEGGGKGCWRSR